jgi:hypothetical protein
MRLACATPSLDGQPRISENTWMTSKKTSAEERQARLARALKRNIALRKEQAKPPAQAVDKADPSPDDNGCPN